MKTKIIALVMVLMLLLTACSISTSSNTETAEQAVSNALNAFKTLDKETISKYLDYDELIDNEVEENEQELADEQIKKMLSKLEYMIVSSEENEDTATVKTEITNINMEKVIREMLGNMFTLAMGEAFKDESIKLTDEEMEQKTYELFDQAIEKYKDEKVTNVIDIKLNKVDGRWKIGIDESMQNAVMGNLLKATNDINNSFNSQGSDSAEETQTPNDVLQEMNNYIVGDIWNDGFCNVSWYTQYGTDSTGGTMDIDFALERLEKAMGKKPEYDNFMNSLSDTEYSEIKSIWNKLSPEIDALYNKIKEEKPAANNADYEFDTGLFTQYHDAFSDEIDKLN